MKTGFIGVGNMAAAMLRGFTGAGKLAPADALVYDVNQSATAALAGELGLAVATGSADVVQNADLIFLCVKPQVMGAVLEEIAPAMAEGKTLVSIAAGLDIAFFTAALGPDAAVVRLMPNMNMMVGQSMTALCPNKAVTPGAAAYVEGLLASVGRVVTLAEKDFPIYTAIAGCSPAYAFLFIDAMARTAVEYGLPKDKATEIAAQAVLGSAQSLLGSGANPWDMIDRVCSPGGTTIAGLAALQEGAFPAVVAKGIRAARDKDIALKQDLAE